MTPVSGWKPLSRSGPLVTAGSIEPGNARSLIGISPGAHFPKFAIVSASSFHKLRKVTGAGKLTDFQCRFRFDASERMACRDRGSSPRRHWSPMPPILLDACDTRVKRDHMEHAFPA